MLWVVCIVMLWVFKPRWNSKATSRMVWYGMKPSNYSNNHHRHNTNNNNTNNTNNNNTHEVVIELKWLRV